MTFRNMLVPKIFLKTPRVLKVCRGLLKIILKPSPYKNLSLRIVKVGLSFLVLSTTIFSRALAQPDVFSLPNEVTITLEPIIIDDPSVAFDEVDQARMEHRSITAVDYCDFLNAEAVADVENLYDEKMGSDPERACVIRCGSPENFSYEVIAGRENFALTYLTPKSASRFLDWLENNLLPAEEDVEQVSEDDNFFLGSNWLGYCISSPSIMPTDALTENSSNAKNVFDYTPGATIGQRILEYLFGSLGIGLGCVIVEPLISITESIPIIATPAIAVVIAVVCLTGGAYLGEKFGKWLGS